MAKDKRRPKPREHPAEVGERIVRALSPLLSGRLTVPLLYALVEAGRDGLTTTELAARFGVSSGTVHRALTAPTYAGLIEYPTMGSGAQRVASRGADKVLGALATATTLVEGAKP